MPMVVGARRAVTMATASTEEDVDGGEMATTSTEEDVEQFQQS